MKYFWICCLWLLALALSSPAQNLVSHGDNWHYRKGTNTPQSNWKMAADTGLDATWLTGNGGIGYADNTPEEAKCQTLLTDMRNVYTTLYMRREFTISSAVDTNLHLVLSMDYDDGYIAFLDGAYLTSGNVNGAPAEPAFNAVAPALHESSLGNSPPLFPPETNDLGLVGTRLSVGTHVLAIVGVNQALS